ncbi:MAG: hypothetical protein AB1750_07485, partial [Chloroflexota bacterium]
VNFLALLTSVWLGLYLVRRSPRRGVTWLTALTLWSLSGMFLNILLALNPPPVSDYHPFWARLLFPFWQPGTGERGASAWLQGWSVAPSIIFWHHSTLLMRPGRMNPWRWTRVSLGYIVCIGAIIAQREALILVAAGEDPLLLNSLRAGPLYTIFGAFLALFIGWSIVNLLRSAYVAPTEMARRQIQTLVSATAFAALLIPVSLVSSGLDLLPVPMAIMSLVLFVFVCMVGFGVARYSALLQGRAIMRDFFYNFLLIGGVTIFYLLAARLIVLAYDAPDVIMVIVPLLAALTHSSMSIAYRLMDSFFFREDTRRLRSNLRQLTRLAGEGAPLKENLDATLTTICASVRATYGLIFSLEGDTARLLSDFKWRGLPIEIGPPALATDDVTHLQPGRFPKPLDEAALLMPLYAESKQVGALVLGQPVNGVTYDEDDVERVLHPADRIADAIHVEQAKAEYIARLSDVAEEHREQTQQAEASIPVDAVENALRSLYDFAYLADTPLANLELVKRKLAGNKTHLERGKAVQSALLEALEEMRPGPTVPREPIPREWYPYLILSDAYRESVSNRDIMLKLYISEGTFNRTRRAAVRSLARALTEMEHPS